MNYFEILFLIIVVESVTEIIVKAGITESFRSFIHVRHYTSTVYKYLNELVNCGYCTSFWIGIFVSVLYYTGLNTYNIIYTGLVLHRLSNALHFFIDILRKGKGE